MRPDSSSSPSGARTFGELGAEVDTTPWDVAALAARWRELKPAQVYVLIGTTRSEGEGRRGAGQHLRDGRLGLTKLAVDAARASRGRSRARLPVVGRRGRRRRARRTCVARGKAEDAVKGSGLPWVIARPSIITGERDDSRLGERTAAVVGDGLLAVAGVFGGKKLRERYRSTTPDVLASALIRLGEAPEHDLDRRRRRAALRLAMTVTVTITAIDASDTTCGTCHSPDVTIFRPASTSIAASP